MAREVGEQVVERLSDTAETADMLFSQKEGDVGRVVEVISSTVLPYT